jgi:PPK2 family polyphosphate:nucleotide phosphotransferase
MVGRISDNPWRMLIDLNDFRVPSGKRVRLKEWPTEITPFFKSDKQYKAHLTADVSVLSALQRLLYASSGYAILLVFQAMDTAGKDSAIGHVLTGINPEGCDVSSFRQPSEEELAHDFLWRTTRRLPARGRIGVFNRSYYEEVLVVRVHPAILANERIPGALSGSKALWKGRYHSIVDLEKHLHRNGTHVIKIFLHLSQEEQRKRLLARIHDPDKNWKFSRADIAERAFWNQYTRAYEECLGATSTNIAPWYVVPADNKDNARLIVSAIVIAALEDLKLHYPRMTAAQRTELRAAGKFLAP